MTAGSVTGEPLELAADPPQPDDAPPTTRPDASVDAEPDDEDDGYVPL